MLKLKTYIHKYYLKFGIILLEFFNIIHDLEEVTINKSCCSKCNEVLCVDSLNRDDILTFLSNIEIKYNMQKFKQWIRKNNSYNVIIDGANVGYYNQRPDLGGTLNVSQIDKIYEYYNSLQKKVLIFLHRKHIVTLEKNDSIYKKWKKTKSIYFTPFKSNDDIYWLYYFLHSKIDTKCSLLITNDNMSDHIFQLLDREQFSRLKNSTILNYDFVNSDLVITSSIEYSEVYQENGDHVHIPFVTNDKILWFCGNKI